MFTRNKHKFALSIVFIGLVYWAHVLYASVTPNMGMDLPQVGVTTGPQWATMIDDAFDIVDAHDHSSGKGVQITPNGLNIDSDLSFQSNDATNLRTSRYTNLTSSQPAAPTDVAVTYFFSGELWANANSGASVQITASGHLNASAINSQAITATQISSGSAASGLPLVSNGAGGASFANATIGGNLVTKTSSYQVLSTDTTVLCNATGGTVSLTLPDPTSNTGKLLWIKKIDSSTNKCLVKRFASETIDGVAQYQLQVQYQSVLVTTDGTNWFIL